MRTSTPERSDHRGSVASVEGYLALLLTVLPFFGPGVDHPTGNPVVGAAYIGIAFGLALGGVRFGNGSGRLAALIALLVLSSFLLLVVVVSLARWEQVLWYWRS